MAVVAIPQLKHGKQQRPLLPRTLTDRRYKQKQTEPRGNKQPETPRKPQMPEWQRSKLPANKRSKPLESKPLESKQLEKPEMPKWHRSKPPVIK